MIPNQWYAILDSREIRRGKLTGFTRMGEKMVAWRNAKGAVSVMGDQCPHRGAALSAGKLIDDCVQCPFHGFEFDQSGTCTLVPANGRASEPPKALRAKTYPTREAHGFIYIWWGEPRETYPPLPFFESIREDMVYASLRDHWTTHYSRAIENQLDVVHLPFVHHNTIGAGGATLVNGPLTRARHPEPGVRLIDIWVYNEQDRGQAPRKASQIPEPGRNPFVQFHFPNLWQLWIADEARVFLAFAPIDEENTMMYLRQYHSVRAPILRQITGLFSMIGDLVILRQDKRVVLTQTPKRTNLNMDELLIPSDGPIIEYRKIRKAMIEGEE